MGTVALFSLFFYPLIPVVLKIDLVYSSDDKLG